MNLQKQESDKQNLSNSEQYEKERQNFNSQNKKAYEPDLKKVQKLEVLEI